MSHLKTIFKFFETMFIWGMHKFKRCSDEEVNHRSSICQGSTNSYDKSKACPEWNPKSYCGFGNCKVCGCTRAKWYVPNTDCPLKKWTINK